MPGGHIDANETLLTTLNREIKEELGVSNFYAERPKPFLLSITEIEHDTRPVSSTLMCGICWKLMALIST